MLILSVGLHYDRIMSLPYKRDGFWMASVIRLYPQNKASNWEGPWNTDGPPTEMFCAVRIHAHCLLFDILL